MISQAEMDRILAAWREPEAGLVSGVPYIQGKATPRFAEVAEHVAHLQEVRKRLNVERKGWKIHMERQRQATKDAEADNDELREEIRLLKQGRSDELQAALERSVTEAGARKKR